MKERNIMADKTNCAISPATKPGEPKNDATQTAINSFVKTMTAANELVQSVPDNCKEQVARYLASQFTDTLKPIIDGIQERVKKYQDSKKLDEDNFKATLTDAAFQMLDCLIRSESEKAATKGNKLDILNDSYENLRLRDRLISVVNSTVLKDTPLIMMDFYQNETITAISTGIERSTGKSTVVIKVVERKLWIPENDPEVVPPPIQQKITSKKAPAKKPAPKKKTSKK